ncbi:MAG: ABC transporter ATP-binding protein [Elusimicrobia bacterium]|nr:ABC transporter ATP-binding protein [Elusimicrobiota bacterium]
MSAPLLSIRDLSVRTCADRAILEQISFDVPSSSIVGIVGGSGSGKTTLGLSLLRLLPGTMRMSAGSLFFEGEDLSGWSSAQMRNSRGRRIAMVFQEPLSAMDPVWTVGEQITETLRVHDGLRGKELRARVLGLLERVRIADVERVFRSYPHELSGGLRQRAMIAQAIACRPSLLVADEPTSSLDVTIQAHIMQLFRDLRRETGLSILLISHDLGVVRHLADRVVVLKGGRVVEQGDRAQVLSVPRAAYTRDLISAEGLA